MGFSVTPPDSSFVTPAKLKWPLFKPATTPEAAPVTKPAEKSEAAVPKTEAPAVKTIPPVFAGRLKPPVERVQLAQHQPPNAGDKYSVNPFTVQNFNLNCPRRTVRTIDFAV